MSPLHKRFIVNIIIQREMSESILKKDADGDTTTTGFGKARDRDDDSLQQHLCVLF